MSIWKQLFGGSDIVNRTLDGVDAVVFTPEERAKHFLELLKHYEPFKLAQRLLALALIVPYVAVWIVCVALFVAAAFYDPQVTGKAQQLVQLSDMLSTRNNDVLGFPVSLVIGFYFAGGMAEGILARWTTKK